MINTSSEFKQEIIKTGRTFATKVVINGKTYTNLTGFKITGGTNSSDVITFGDSVSSYMECTICEVPDTDHLENKIAIAYIGLQLSKSIEWIKMGTFTVSEAKRDDKDVKIHADDNMLKCTKGFFTDLKGNQSIATVLNEQCAKIGISFVGGADNASVNVDKLLGMTIREVIGILASFCGKNAVMNRDGNLKFVWYDDSALKISAESFSDPLNVNESDTLINRVRCTIDKDKEVNVGTGMGIEFSNPLMTEAQLQVIAKRVIGFKYRACDLNFMVGRPDIEAGDIIKVVDKRGNTFIVPIMDITTECDGGTWNKIKSKAKTETSKEFESKGPMTQMVERTYSELTVTKKLITETIDAFEGNFETINTNYLNVSGKITAVEGGFEILKSDTAIFKTTVTDKLSAIDATIVTLNLEYGKIGTMDVELARINTLLAGSITSGSTQTIVLNAQNTTIANALIKSAMIDSLGANKITTGTIDASSIHFKSKTGNMDIFDNTISIRDANRVRVQIGKDASSDYNIYVWDKVGKLMFDATGLKADGIKDKIIRDDMVSDTANINGAKLNITSLVTEINNGTSNIKSSHITYDPTGQSLNVAFNSLTSKIDDLEIGGRNLLKNSNSIDLLSTDNPTYSKREVGKITSLIEVLGERNAYTFVKTNLSKSFLELTSTARTYAFSVDVKCSSMSDLSYLYFAIDFRTASGDYPISTIKKLYKKDCGGKWFRFSGSLLTITEQMASTPEMFTNSLVRCVFYSFPVNATIEYRNFKFEVGNKSTDWTPAPEDIEDKVTSLSTSLTVEQGRINALITSDTTIKGDITKVQSDYTSIKATVSGLSTTVGSHTSSIQTVTNTVTNNKANWDKAGSALTTAENAKNAIDGLEIGGRNLSPLKTIGRYSGGATVSGDLTNLKITGYKIETIAIPRDLIGFVASNFTASKISISGFSNLATLNIYYKFNNANQLNTTAKTTNGKFTLFLNVPIGATSVNIGLGQHPFVANYYVEKIMIVNGDKPLDHVPAPEDIESSIKVVTDKQTSLDVTIAGITGRVSSVETVSTTNKNSISGLTTTVNETKSNVSAMQLDLTGFKTSVASTYTKITEFNALEIGGRNLIRKPFFSDVPWKNAVINYDATYKGKKCIQVKNNILYGNSGNGTTTLFPEITFEANKQYAFSVEGAENDDYTAVYCMYFRFLYTDGTYGQCIINTKNWKTYRYITVAGKTLSKIVTTYNTGGTIFIYNMKLENGNRHTDYTPAPEDIDANIKSVTDKQTAFDVTIAGITSRVSSVETNVTTAKSTADNALLKLDVETMTSDMKLFKNVCAFSGTGSAKGYLIITTPITPNRMVKLHISGYNYIEKNETIDVSIGFYNYDASMLAHGFTNKGSFKIPTIKIAKISATDTRAVIIIGDATTLWGYAKIIVDEVIIAHNVASNAYKDGFSATVTASLPAYIQTVTVDGSDFKSEITTTKTEVAEHTVKLGQITSRVSTTESKITGIEMLNFNNFSRTGKLDGWIPVGALTLVNDSTYGKVAQITTAGDVQVTSPLFEVDANKTYKIGLTMRKADTKKGTIYFGIYCYDENKANVGSYNSSGSLNTNYYFFNTSGALADWFSVEGYLCASNIDKTQMPKGKNTTVSLAMHPKTKYVLLRFLNYSHDTGVASTMQYAQPFIMEGDGLIGTIDTRISSAELKITDSAIVSTVTKSSNWTSLNDKLTNTVGLLEIKDTRSTNQNPQWYMTNYPKKTVKELKLCASVGVGGEVALSTLITEISWADSSGGYPTQLLYPNNSQNIYRRVGTSNTAWGAWTKVAGSHNIVSSINQTAEAIKISASKIDLTGYVTITNLATSGKTTIDGGNIKTGTINAIDIIGSTIKGGSIQGVTIVGGTVRSIDYDKGFYTLLRNGVICIGQNLEDYGQLTASWNTSNPSQHYIGLIAAKNAYAIKLGQSLTDTSFLSYYTMYVGPDIPTVETTSSKGRHSFLGKMNVTSDDGCGVSFYSTFSKDQCYNIGSNQKLCLISHELRTVFRSGAFEKMWDPSNYEGFVCRESKGFIFQSSGGVGSLRIYGTKNSDGFFNYRTDCHRGHWFDTTVSAMAWETRSSETIKANIAPFELMQNNACDIIKSAKVYEYNLKEELSKGIQQKHYGFVIERETPKLLLSSSGQGIDTYTMASINWQATKELIVSRSELIREIETLKSRITQLEMRS